MFNISTPPSYSSNYLELSKCRPFIDKLHIKLIRDIISKKDYDWNCIDDSFNVAQFTGTASIYNKFKNLFQSHITGSKLNKITGLETATRVDIIQGCTQYIENIHLKGDVQVLENEYSYHYKINPRAIICKVENLQPGIPLIVSIPFSNIGAARQDMLELLNTCITLNVPVHLDGAWITAAKNIDIDFCHPAIASLGISMSKGYGTSGWNRIGLRWTKSSVEDSITLINEHLQLTAYSVVIGNYILENTMPDHLWNTHGNHHNKICNDFNLTSSDTIHMATTESNIIGLAPLLRYLENV
jgi:hypothetical protein